MPDGWNEPNHGRQAMFLDVYAESMQAALDDVGIKMSEFQKALLSKSVLEGDYDRIRGAMPGLEKRVSQAEIDEAIESIKQAAQ